jgi:4-carboxymuconolactone decarboxylase
MQRKRTSRTLLFCGVDPKRLGNIAPSHKKGFNMTKAKDTLATHPLAELAPKFIELSSDVLFNDVWERPGLSKRERSLITVASLVSMYRQNELPFHLKKALENGLTKEELVEAITHLAFYSGWPTAATALTIAKSIFEAS